MRSEKKFANYNLLNHVFFRLIEKPHSIVIIIKHYDNDVSCFSNMIKSCDKSIYL